MGSRQRRDALVPWLYGACLAGLVGGDVSLVASEFRRLGPFTWALSKAGTGLQTVGALGLEIVAGLIVAIIVSFSAGYLVRGQRYKQKYIAAPAQFTKQITDAIAEAMRDLNRSGDVYPADRALVQARIIVATRDSLRDSLTSVAKLLNSEIDTLAGLVAEANTAQRVNGSIPDGIRRPLIDNIRVLEGVWKTKSSQIELEIRKLRTELGMVEEGG